MTSPTLPQNDPAIDERKAQLANARVSYQFDFSYQEIVSAKKVPLREKSDPHYWLALAEVTGELKANQLASRSLEENVDAIGEKFVQGLADAFAKLAPGEIAERLKKETRASPPPETDRSPESYDKMYARIAPPSVSARWAEDEIFAWQALAGCNPIMIHRFAGMPHFGVTAAHFDSAMKALKVEGAGTYESALKEGRLFVADYQILDHITPGAYEGAPKFIFAPLALYVSLPGGRFLPVAIQCGQTPEAGIFTPADGMSWRMARTVVTSADGNFQGIISHFAWCHEVMESVILSTHRQLADNHPLHVLLSPHFANTMITNDIAMTSLIGPNGNMERLQSGTLESSLDLAKRSIREFRLLDSAPAKDFAARGVDDTDALAAYPFRDDSLRSWGPLQAWVRGYLELYYTSDELVAGDHELAAWVDELGSHEGGRLLGLERPQTFDALVDFVAQIMFRCTVFHAAFNYTSYDFFAYAPNVQAAAFGPGPTGTDADTVETLQAMWPPYQSAYEGMHLFYTIFKVQLNRVGYYPDGHFTDPRVAPLETALKAALDEAEAAIAKDDDKRILSYPYLMPSRVSNSIHV